LAEDLGVVGVAELGAPDGEAAGSERACSVGIGKPKTLEQAAPAVWPVLGEVLSLHLDVPAVMQ
jgi:hypothetical protein